MPAEAKERRWNSKCVIVAVIAKFVAGCLLTLASAWGGTAFLFCIELKSLFHLSQTQVEIIIGLYMMAIFCVLPHALIHKTFGFYVAFGVASFLTCLGYLLMAMAAVMPETFRRLPGLLYVFLLMFTNGRCGLFFLVLMTVMTTTPKAHRGKALSCNTTMVFVGEIIASLIYKDQFADVTRTGQYFMVCFYLVASALVLYVVTYVANGGTEQVVDEERSLLDNREQADNESSVQNISREVSSCKVKRTSTDDASDDNPDSKGNESISAVEMFYSCTFHLYLWSGSLILACNIIYFTNVFVLLQSLQMSEYQNAVVTTMMTTIIVSQLLSGVLYDYLDTTSNKVFLMIGVAVCNVLTFVTLLINMNSVVVIFVSVVFMSVTMGVGQSVYFTFGEKIFGNKNLGIVQGFLLTFYDVFVIILSLICGVIYDHFVPTENSHNCYGIDCFWWTWLIILGLSFLAGLLPIFLLCHVRKREQSLPTT